MSGKIAQNPNRQSGTIGNIPSATIDASSPTITTNPSTGVGAEWINTTTGEIFLCTNATTDNNIWVGQIGNTIQPTPWGDRGIFFAQSTPSARNDIAYINITVLGNTSDFGNLTAQGSAGQNGWSNGTRAFAISVGGETSAIDYFNTTSPGDAADFGDTSDGNLQTGSGNRTRMVITGSGVSDAGGYKYVEMDSLGDAVDFGECEDTAGICGVLSNGGDDRMIKGGGRRGSDPGSVNAIEYITVSSLGNGTDFGNLTVARDGLAGASDASRGIFFSGYTHPGGGQVDTIDYITIDSVGDATDFGNVNPDVREYGATYNATRAMCGGGWDQSAGTGIQQISYVTKSTTGDAADFGDIYAAGRGVGGVSGDIS